MSPKIVIACLLCLGVLSSPVLLCADDVTTLESVLQRALNDSPLVKEIERRTLLQQGEGIALGSLENPALDAELRIPTSYRESRGASEVTVALSQPLRWSDFGVRGRVNALIQRSAQIEKKIALLEFAQSIRLAYAKSWLIESRLDQLRSYQQKAEGLRVSLEGAKDRGLVGEGEGHLLLAELRKTSLLLSAWQSDHERARAELERIAGFQIVGRVARPPLEEIPQHALDSNDSEIPMRTRAELAVKLAQEQQRLARLDAYPKFAPRAVYERTNDYTDYFGVGIALELPVFNRNRHEQRTRAAEVSAAELNKNYLTGERFQNELDALRSSVNTGVKLVRAYESEVLPALRAALSAEERVLHSGQGSPFRVWQMLRELSATEAELIERTLALYRDRAALSSLTGCDL
ncbi:MAG: TolC family protein [Bdellovibrionota bacterium]|nr:MAG: TolC family protein [Bdellovibrionota bacterium]